VVKTRVDRIVGVRVRYEEAAIQTAVRASGAKWDKPAKLWRLSFCVAVVHDLRERVVETWPVSPINGNMLPDLGCCLCVAITLAAIGDRLA
jgi:hypothetical protein